VGRAVPRRTTAAPTITTARAQESEETKKRERNANRQGKVSSSGERARKARAQLRSDHAAARKDEVRKRATRELIGILEQVVEQSSTRIPLRPKHPHDQN
jgi:hypothetical protein